MNSKADLIHSHILLLNDKVISIYIFSWKRYSELLSSAGTDSTYLSHAMISRAVVRWCLVWVFFFFLFFFCLSVLVFNFIVVGFVFSFVLFFLFRYWNQGNGLMVDFYYYGPVCYLMIWDVQSQDTKIWFHKHNTKLLILSFLLNILSGTVTFSTFLFFKRVHWM